MLFPIVTTPLNVITPLNLIDLHKSDRPHPSRPRRKYSHHYRVQDVDKGLKPLVHWW